MPSPFPGMDPYLESPHLWPDVHHSLLNQIRNVLQQILRPRHVVRVSLRVYESDERCLRDPEIKEARLEIRSPRSDSPVTRIEIVSPSNKRVGSPGRSSFMEAREQSLKLGMSFVEIDLLRSGTKCTHMPLPASDYRIVATRQLDEARHYCWPIGVRQSLPTITIPLPEKTEIPLDLGAVLNAAYDHAGYDLSIDYRREPDPPLTGADKAWAEKLLRERGLRSK